jgi:hypothetical protein
MDSATASACVPKKKVKRAPRSLSASESVFFDCTLYVGSCLTSPLRIAKNAKAFDIWCSAQRCEEVAFSDLPEEFKENVQSVFNTLGRLPAGWLDKVRTSFIALASTKSNNIAAVVDLVIQVLSKTEGNLQFRIHGVPRQSESRVSFDIFQGRPRQWTLSPLGRAQSCVLILGTPREDSNRIQRQGLGG